MGSWPLLMIGLASPYPAREPTHPLVAGPGFGPARHLGDRARPIRHHPDPPTPFAHGTLPAVRPTLRSRTQPLRADLGRPALGRPRRPDPAAGAPPVLRQRRLRAAHLRRAPARHRRALGSQDGAPHHAADGDRPRAGRCRRRSAQPRSARAGRAQHPAAVGPGRPFATPGHPGCPRGRRLGAAQAPQLRHRAGRPGAAPAGGAAARPRGRDPRPLAAGPPRGRDRGARPRRRLRRRDPARRARGEAGRRPLPPLAEPGGGAGDHLHGARRQPARGRAGGASSGTGRPGHGRPACAAAAGRGRPGQGRRAAAAAAGPVPAGLAAAPRGLGRSRDRPAPRPRPEHGGSLPAARDVPRAQGARRRRAEPARPLEAAPPGAVERRPARQPAPVPRAAGAGLPRQLRHPGALHAAPAAGAGGGRAPAAPPEAAPPPPRGRPPPAAADPPPPRAAGAAAARAPPPPPVVDPPGRPLTPRTAAWLALRRPERRDPDGAERLARLGERDPKLAEAVGLAEEFAGLLRAREPGRLDPWLARARDGPLPAFRGFAARLATDEAAVRAAATSPWSTGPVEGQINRLKTLKRQMYGRAKLDLLGRRFLLAA